MAESQISPSWHHKALDDSAMNNRTDCQANVSVVLTISIYMFKRRPCYVAIRFKSSGYCIPTCRSRKVRMAWERLEAALALVAAVVRARRPATRQPNMSSWLATATSRSPTCGGQIQVQLQSC